MSMKAPRWFKNLSIAIAVLALLLTVQTTHSENHSGSAGAAENEDSTLLTTPSPPPSAPPRLEEVWRGGVWVASILKNKTEEIDPLTNKPKEQSCPCPDGCTNCAFQDGSLFLSNDNTVRTLTASDTPPKISFDPANGNSSFAFQSKEGTTIDLTSCPNTSSLVCFACNEGLGYYATAFTGEYLQEGITHTGSGVACIYHYTCSEDGNCQETLNREEASNYCAFAAILFVAFYIFYAWMRRIPFVVQIMDPIVTLDRSKTEYENVPKLQPAIEGYFGFGWLYQAFISSDTFIRRFTTIDEFMVMRWFRMCAKFFAICSIIICPALWELFAKDHYDETSVRETASVSSVAIDHTGADIKIHTLGAAKKMETFVVVTIMMYIFSLVLVFMIEKESVKYALMMWKLEPKEVGIKMNTVTILNIPRYATTTIDSMNIKSTLNQVAIQNLEEQKDAMKEKKDLLVVKQRMLKMKAMFNAVVPWWMRDFGSPEIEEKYREDMANDVQMTHDVSFDESERKEMANLRLLTRREIEHMLRVKIEAIVGKGNIMFVCVAHDLRFVTKKTEMWKEARENAIQANRKVVLIESEKTEHPGTWKRNLKSREAHLQSAKKHRDACEAEEASKLRALDAAKEKIINSQAPPTGAVVVLKSQALAILISNVQIDEDFGKWDTRPAPAPQSIVWHNVASPNNKRSWKTMRTRIVSILFALFFLGPVNVITAAVNDHKTDIVNSIGGTYGETFYSIVISLIMLTFLVIAHIISLHLSRQTGYISLNEMDTFGATTYFYVLIINLVLGNMSSRYVWEDMYDWIQEPHLFAYTFMRQTLACSTFFFKFVLLRLAQATTFELIRFPKLFSFLVNYTSYRMKAKVEPPYSKILEWARPEETPMHRIPGVTMLIFFIGSLYAVIAPILLPACCAFFFILYIFFKHQLVYHYKQSHPGEGDMWSWLVGKMFFTLIFVQLVMILGIPTMGYESGTFRIFLLPLPFISYLQMTKTNRILMQALKTPLYGLNDKSDREEKRAAFLNKEKSRKSRAERAEEAARARLAAASVRLAEDRGVDVEELGDIDTPDAEFKDETEPLRPREYLEPSLESEDSITRGILTNASLAKFKKLEETLDTANAANELLERKEWRQYQPKSVMPLSKERSAMSIILKRWRENHAKRKEKETAGKNKK